MPALSRMESNFDRVQLRLLLTREPCCLLTIACVSGLWPEAIATDMVSLRLIILDEVTAQPECMVPTTKPPSLVSRPRIRHM